jgi:hypothetical protein
MQITFSYASGRRTVAVVLAVGADFIRVVAPRRADGFDIYLRDQEWVTETGKTIRVDAILFGDGALVPSAVSPVRGRSSGGKKAEVGGASG